jgi:hypothetical protein
LRAGQGAKCDIGNDWLSTLRDFGCEPRNGGDDGDDASASTLRGKGSSRQALPFRCAAPSGDNGEPSRAGQGASCDIGGNPRLLRYRSIAFLSSSSSSSLFAGGSAFSSVPAVPAANVATSGLSAAALLLLAATRRHRSLE